jgi:hypothetical protein
MNTQQLWQAQALDAPRISLAFVRHRSDALRRWTRMRNAINYVGPAVLLPFIAWRAWHIFKVMPLYSLAIAWVLLSGAYLTFRWHKRAASQQQPAELGVLDALKFHRLQLERQRDVRLDRWRRWPALPGILLMFVALGVEVRPTPWVLMGLLAVVMVTIIGTSMVFEERIARRLQKEIDALDSL